MYVKGTYFDSDTAKYSDSLPYKDESILQAVIKAVYKYSIRVKFLIDDQVTSISKNCELLDIEEDKQKFIIGSLYVDENAKTSENSFVFENANELDVSDLESLASSLGDQDYQPIQKNRSTSSDSDTDESDNDFYKEVYLIHNDNKIFKGLYSPGEGNTVHFRSIDGENVRFLIKKVMTGCRTWPNFDEDYHSEGSYILWSKNDTLKVGRMRKPIQFNTEAKAPQSLDERKRKRPETWIKEKRRRELQSGQRGKGRNSMDDVSRPVGNLKPGCQCKKKCTDKFTAEDRMKINKDFWRLGDTERQQMFITKYVSTAKKARCRTREQSKTGKRRVRMLTRKYSLLSSSRGVSCDECQLFFLNALNIDKKRVETAILKLTESGAVLELATTIRRLKNVSIQSLLI